MRYLLHFFLIRRKVRIPSTHLLLLLQVRENPETGHEELIVLAGYCSETLATMNPHRLDLVTWQWFRESGLVPNPGPGDATVLPIPRQRAAGEVVGKKWVLVHAGSPTQVSHVLCTA